ncbi:MAG: hypothetical protein ACOH2S_19740 [Janthinobacterium svalbardensis]|uniref:Uncharacterized protein n=1 Tax=Janthinobacterium svalbardensis TaxID=368607 RepID=A0A290X036_9BURK|nr:hypothetical protein [Janthinobacterium svalbardensis]ATD62470.1 hypothetical protein CNX70_21725 [Janthinobacterium svalbardensis]
MKKLLAVLAGSATALLTGCGGGGGTTQQLAGDSGSASPLAAYIGTWQSACDHHDRQTLVIAIKSDGSGSLELTPTGETYFKADCSGPVVATDSINAKITGKPDGTADMLIKLAENAAATSLRVDKITSSIPAYTFQRTGTTVKYVLRDGKNNWCVDVDNGDSCMQDDGMQPALSVPGGLSLRGNDLYTVMLDKGAYVLDMHYVKK